jgi:predicted DNA-binding transcriptional regulator AlpA
MLSREQAAKYIGVSAGKFNQMVDDGRMPKPLRWDTRVVWDISKLDAAIDEAQKQAEEDTIPDEWSNPSL